MALIFIEISFADPFKSDRFRIRKYHGRTTVVWTMVHLPLCDHARTMVQPQHLEIRDVSHEQRIKIECESPLKSTRQTYRFNLGHLSSEGHEVMLAHWEHLDVAHNHHLVVFFVEHSVVQNVYSSQTVQQILLLAINWDWNEVLNIDMHG